MADLPQHMAIAAVLASPTETGLGYDEGTHIIWWTATTLYLLPYVWTAGLSKWVGVRLAMRSVVFLSMALFPIGIGLILRAQRKPVLWTILALPFVTTEPSFGGFQFQSVDFFGARLYWARDFESSKNAEQSCAELLGLATSAPRIYGMAFYWGTACSVFPRAVERISCVGSYPH